VTGDEHYRKAEKLLETVQDAGYWVGPTPGDVAQAQAHATLALAAATWAVPGNVGTSYGFGSVAEGDESGGSPRAGNPQPSPSVENQGTDPDTVDTPPSHDRAVAVWDGLNGELYRRTPNRSWAPVHDLTRPTRGAELMDAIDRNEPGRLSWLIR
jgi:hypothetical protein